MNPSRRTKKLKKFRLASDLSQKSLAGILGVSRSSVRKLEAGKTSKGAGAPGYKYCGNRIRNYLNSRHYVCDF